MFLLGAEKNPLQCPNDRREFPRSVSGLGSNVMVRMSKVNRNRATSLIDHARVFKSRDV